MNRPPTRPQRRRQSADAQVIEAFDLGYTCGQSDERRFWRELVQGLVEAIEEGRVNEYWQEVSFSAEVEKWLIDGEQEGDNQ